MAFINENSELDLKGPTNHLIQGRDLKWRFCESFESERDLKWAFRESFDSRTELKKNGVHHESFDSESGDLKWRFANHLMQTGLKMAFRESFDSERDLKMAFRESFDSERDLKWRSRII